MWNELAVWLKGAWRESEWHHWGCSTKMMNNSAQKLLFFIAGVALHSRGFKYILKGPLFRIWISYLFASFIYHVITVPAVSVHKAMTVYKPRTRTHREVCGQQEIKHHKYCTFSHLREGAISLLLYSDDNIQTGVNYTEYIQNETLRLLTGWNIIHATKPAQCQSVHFKSGFFSFLLHVFFSLYYSQCSYILGLIYTTKMKFI